MVYLQKKPESIMLVQSLFTQPSEKLQQVRFTCFYNNYIND